MEKKKHEKKDLLDAEIRTRISGLALLEPGSEEFTAEVNAIDKLYKLSLEEDNSKKDRVCKVIVSGVETVLPLAAYGILFGVGLKFEETGIFTSNMMKGLLQKFRIFK